MVTRNWRTARGEIDIIAWEGDVLAVCEVKTRRGVAFGTPAEAINRAKARRLRRLAALWLASDDSAKTTGHILSVDSGLLVS